MAKESGGSSTTSVTSKNNNNNRSQILEAAKSVSLYDSSQTIINHARDKAVDMANTAKNWLQPDWSTPMAHFESLTTVMFSPMAAHPVYRSESLVKAIQLAQQQQRHRPTSSSSTTTASDITDLVLHSYGSSSTYPWPSSSVLLKAEIPESSSSLSLFQGFATTYPSLTAKKSSTSKKSRNKKKKQQQVDLDVNKLQDKPVSLKRVFAERERKIREIDKLQMQMTSTSNEIRQIDLQIDELINKRKELETKWTKLETKEQQIQLTIEELTEKILDETDDQSSVLGTTKKSRQYQMEEESDEEYEFGECFKSLHGHERGILCIDFNDPKGQLVSSSLDGTLRVWDLRNGRVCGQLDGHHNLVRCLQLDDMRLITGSDDGKIKQWDLSDVSNAPTPVSADSFSGYSSAPASPSLAPQKMNDNNTPLTLNTSCVSSFDGHQSEITALHADTTNLVTGSNDKTMKLWDLETQSCVLTMDVMWASQHSGSSISTSSSSWSFNFFEPAVDYVGALQFWNFALASGTVDGKLRMWDLRTGQAHRTLPGHKGAITALQFDEIHLVSGSADKTIRIWDLRTGSVFETLTFSEPVSSLRFNTERIMSTTIDTNDIHIYNRTSFQRSKLTGHTDSANTLQLKKDTLASGGKDGVVKLWAM